MGAALNAQVAMKFKLFLLDFVQVYVTTGLTTIKKFLLLLIQNLTGR